MAARNVKNPPANNHAFCVALHTVFDLQPMMYYAPSKTYLFNSKEIQSYVHSSDANRIRGHCVDVSAPVRSRNSECCLQI